ncbi:hypothetical protein TA3x_005366 [Tundrisphaera sp. TA3]|uniref:hypothetical protein n=1 Tax=Tundrisphaera sp. TA3 TaxID=3435775 RepID=UPI003EBC6A39
MMGFFNALRRIITDDRPVARNLDPREIEARYHDDSGEADEAPLPEAPPFESGKYDRAQWAKKVKRVLEELPDSRPQWDDLVAEARSMGFEPGWAHRCQVDEFHLMLRRIVSDRVVTEAEHRKLDLARDLIGIPEAEAVAALEKIVAEAESFFGDKVEGA